MEKNETNQTIPHSRTSSLLSGYEGLIVAMLELMMRDLTIPDSEIQINPYDSKKVRQQKKKKKSYKQSAYCFVRSEWFEDLCFLVGINPRPMRRHAIQRYMEAKKK